jgi:hypothetical protein
MRSCFDAHLRRHITCYGWSGVSAGLVLFLWRARKRRQPEDDEFFVRCRFLRSETVPCLGSARGLFPWIHSPGTTAARALGVRVCEGQVTVGGEGVRVRLSATTTRDTRPGQRKARLLLEVPRGA